MEVTVSKTSQDNKVRRKHLEMTEAITVKNATLGTQEKVKDSAIASLTPTNIQSALLISVILEIWIKKEKVDIRPPEEAETIPKTETRILLNPDRTPSIRMTNNTVNTEITTMSTKQKAKNATQMAIKRNFQASHIDSNMMIYSKTVIDMRVIPHRSMSEITM